MFNHIFDGFSARAKVFTRVKLARFFSENLPDFRRQSHSQICIDIDLADRHFYCLADGLLRHTHCIRHIAAILVDKVFEFGQNAARAVHNQRIPRQLIPNLLQNIESQFRLLFELVSAVTCPYGNRQ